VFGFIRADVKGAARREAMSVGATGP
jgi:hypothetical protein